MAEGTRRAVAGWGLELLCKEDRWKSDSLTVVEVPSSVNADDVVVNAYSRYNLSLGVGLAKVPVTAGKCEFVCMYSLRQDFNRASRHSMIVCGHDARRWLARCSALDTWATRMR